MTHFISKPFDVPSTITLIQRLTRQAVINAASQPLPLSLAWAPESTVINVTEGLKIWTDMPAYQDWLGRFVETYAGAVSLIQSNLASNDSAAAVALAHKLAGVAANLALPDVFRTATEVELALGLSRDAEVALAELATAMELAVATIQRMNAA